MKLLRITGLILLILATLSFTSYKLYEVRSLDTISPEITYEGDVITAGVEVTQEELLHGVSAFDEKDGDVTQSLMIESISKFVTPGERTIVYAAYDSSNNVTKRERKLIYSDYTTTKFALSKPLIFTVGDENILEAMSAFDAIDGDVTDKIKYEETDYEFGEEEGTYLVKFQVTNSAGDTAYLPAEVEYHYPGYEFTDRIHQITLSDYLIYLKTGDNFNTRSYIQGVSIGSTEYPLDEIQTKSNVNTRVSGVYQVVYTMTSEEGYTGSTKLLVVVED